MFSLRGKRWCGPDDDPTGWKDPPTDRGQALVEFLLIVPVACFALLGIADAGRLAVFKADQDRRVAVVAEWVAVHDSATYAREFDDILAVEDFDSCDVTVDEVAVDVVGVGATCPFEPMFLKGLWDGLPVASNATAAVGDDPSPSPSTTPSPEPS